MQNIIPKSKKEHTKCKDKEVKEIRKHFLNPKINSVDFTLNYKEKEKTRKFIYSNQNDLLAQMCILTFTYFMKFDNKNSLAKMFIFCIELED